VPAGLVTDRSRACATGLAAGKGDLEHARPERCRRRSDRGRGGSVHLPCAEATPRRQGPFAQTVMRAAGSGLGRITASASKRRPPRRQNTGRMK
jgi:hypothetical protein